MISSLDPKLTIPLRVHRSYAESTYYHDNTLTIISILTYLIFHRKKSNRYLGKKKTGHKFISLATACVFICYWNKIQKKNCKSFETMEKKETLDQEDTNWAVFIIAMEPLTKISKKYIRLYEIVCSFHGDKEVVFNSDNTNEFICRGIQPDNWLK